MKTSSIISIIGILLCLAPQSGVQTQKALSQPDGLHTSHPPFDQHPHIQTRSESFLNGVETDWVRHYSSGLVASPDIATALAADDSGNVYVTGYSTNLPFEIDYLTVKYDPSGNQMWTARYNGPGNTDDIARALCVDPFGNVYVTGGSQGQDGNFDYATVKYNSNGMLEWVVRYNGQGNGDDEAAALTLDGSGSLYVTGCSWDSGTDFDYTTVRYNCAGVQEWVARYDGPGDGPDRPASLTLDTFGNIYVTGGSDGFDSGHDYATVKYNSAGVEQWVARYNGPGNDHDEAAALTVDDSGNVYVTGWSEGSGTDYDYATVKYDSLGTRQWVARYNGPANSCDIAKALAIDGSGNVYVTGGKDKYTDFSGTFYDFATVKYDSEGNQQWERHYTGPEDYYDECAVALAVDSSDNVYVTGYTGFDLLYIGEYYDYVTIKYNSAGEEQWVVLYDGPSEYDDRAEAITLDGSGNVYVTGFSVGVGSNFDYATVKYNIDGCEQWVARYEYQGRGWDNATALAVDGSGNVFVTGYSMGPGSDYDYATLKYNPDGVQQWLNRYNEPENISDYARDVAVDASGNIYVTGYSNNNYVTLKYNSSGVQEWISSYDGPGHSTDDPQALAIDGSGNIYVTGFSKGSGTKDDYATVKYDPDGVQQWVARYNGPDDSYDWATAIAVDRSGNVHVTGYSFSPHSDRDYATVKYDSNGVQQWATRYNGPGNGEDEPYAIAVDEAGNVYVTGITHTFLHDDDYATVKYDTDGIEQWVAYYNGPEDYVDGASDLALDDSGNVYVTGKSYGVGTNSDYVTIKYDPDGTEQWVARYDGPENANDYAKILKIDVSGNVYVTGNSDSWGTARDFVTIKYGPDGKEQWFIRYDSPCHYSDLASAMVIDKAGDVYVTGRSQGANGTFYSTVKYAQIQTSPGLKGDVNGDGSVNILDIVAVVRHVLDIEILTGHALWRADCNGDAVIDVLDVFGIVNIVLGVGECDPAFHRP